MPIPGCKLRKCQGRRGCLCPSRPAKAQPYAHVSESLHQLPSNTSRPAAAATPSAPKAVVVENGAATEVVVTPPLVPTVPADPVALTPTVPHGALAADTEAQAAVDTGSSAKGGDGDVTNESEGGGDEPSASPVVEATPAVPAPSEPDAPPEPSEGEVTLRYNHYKHQFTIVAPPGKVSIAEINERFSFSYGFQGDYKIHLRGPGPNGDLLASKLLRTTQFLEMAEEGDEIVGLQLGLEYFCDVEEDPEEAKKERKAYKAQTVDNTVNTSDGAQNGEDSASCSCIEGNPCAVKYNCKDWNGRFEVAKANGWKGF